MNAASGPDASTDHLAGRGALDLAGIECSDLAPALATYVRRFPAGTIACVRTARPSAMEGIRSWCRLTGNLLEREAPVDGGAVEFSIRRKTSPAAQ